MANGATDTVLIYMSGSDVYWKKNGSDQGALVWPVTVTNTSPANILPTLFDDITLNNNTSQYFICGSDGIQFGSRSLRPDGSRPTITIDGITGYPGLIQNGTPSQSGYNSIYVCNLIINSVNSATLSNSSGWFGQSFFGNNAKNNMFINCTSTGNIPTKGGGIVGSSASSIVDNLILDHCNSMGMIGVEGGGIVGAFPSSVMCKECFSSGQIGSTAGGIFGDFPRSCYAVRCYSTNSIGVSAGGIFGDNCFNIYADGCYSEGSINNQAGGIIGTNASLINVLNCYSRGTIGSGAGGILGVGSGGSVSNSYSANGSWDTSAAQAALDMTNWFNPSTIVNTPFYIKNFGYSLYTQDNIAADYSLIKTYTATVNAGGSTDSSIVTGYTFTEDSIEPTITINAGTGQISTTTATPIGVYIFYVLGSINPYHHIEVTLTVNSQPIPPSTSCCPTGEDLTGLAYDIITQAQAGKAMIVDRSQNMLFRFNSYEDYMTYKKTLALRRFT